MEDDKDKYSFFLKEELRRAEGQETIFRSYFKEYLNLASKVKKRRNNMIEFMKHLHEKTSFLESPASSIYHLNIKYGLLIHSVNVTQTLLKIKKVLAPSIEDESCVIVGLYHDCGKVGYPGRPYYIDDGKGGYKSNPKVRAMAIATRSLFLISGFIPLTPDEAQAIAYHDGLYVPEGTHVQNKECPLLLLTHYSDMWSAHVIECNLPDVLDDKYVWGEEIFKKRS